MAPSRLPGETLGIPLTAVRTDGLMPYVGWEAAYGGHVVQHRRALCPQAACGWQGCWTVHLHGFVLSAAVCWFRSGLQQFGTWRQGLKEGRLTLRLLYLPGSMAIWQLWAAILSSSVGSKQTHFGLIFSESHWGPYPKDTGP